MEERLRFSIAPWKATAWVFQFHNHLIPISHHPAPKSPTVPLADVAPGRQAPPKLTPPVARRRVGEVGTSSARGDFPFSPSILITLCSGEAPKLKLLAFAPIPFFCLFNRVCTYIK